MEDRAARLAADRRDARGFWYRHPATAVGVPLRPVRHLQSWEVLRTLEQPDALVVEHKDRHQVRGIRTEHCATNKVHDDIAPSGLSDIACIIGELTHGIAGNTARCKGEHRLL